MNISKWKFKAIVVKNSRMICKASVSLNYQCQSHSFLNAVHKCASVQGFGGFPFASRPVSH